MTLLGDITADGASGFPPDHARILIHGRSGTGKTTLASSIAEVGKTLFIYVPGEDGINSINGLPWMDNVVPHRLGSKKHPIIEMEELYSSFLKGEHDFDAVCFDSVSALQTLWKKHLLRIPLDAPMEAAKRPATDFVFWGQVRDTFTDFFTFWYGLASSTAKKPVHVVMTSQTNALDDVEGATKMQPDLHKGPLAAALSRPDQILYTHMMRDPENFDKMKHVVRIKPSDKVDAKTRVAADIADGLPEVIGIKKRATLADYLSVVGVAGL